MFSQAGWLQPARPEIRKAAAASSSRRPVACVNADG